MRLVSVYDDDKIERVKAAEILWNLLVERPAYANISHKEMPTWQMHLCFVGMLPYEAWYLIEVPDCGYVGAIYLTREDEIGVGIFEAYRHQGHGGVALRQLMALHPRKRYLAHVSPINLAGQAFWLKQGFKPLQVTYALKPKAE